MNEAPDGYPRLATFLDSDENFMLYRRFGYLQSRLLLEKQDDLRRLESQLEVMDYEDNVPARRDILKTRLYHDDECAKERKALVEKIEKKWLEYCESVLDTIATAFPAILLLFPLPRERHTERSITLISFIHGQRI